MGSWLLACLQDFSWLKSVQYYSLNKLLSRVGVKLSWTYGQWFIRSKLCSKGGQHYLQENSKGFASTYVMELVWARVQILRLKLPQLNTFLHWIQDTAWEWVWIVYCLSKNFKPVINGVEISFTFCTRNEGNTGRPHLRRLQVVWHTLSKLFKFQFGACC